MPDAKLKERPEGMKAGGRLEPTAYEGDFYAWTIEQASAVRAGRFRELDIEHLAEEIEDLGKEVFKGLRSSIRIILVHMLKWDHQPERRSRGWLASIRTQRIDVEQVMVENPSLRHRLDEAITIGYRQARIKAAAEMKRSERELPSTCPYSLDEILNRPFEWPEP